MRSSRAVCQGFKPTVLVASEPLVPILPADPEAFTLLGERLVALYRRAASLTIDEHVPRGVIATIRVPATAGK